MTLDVASTELRLRFRGKLSSLSAEELQLLFDRSASREDAVAKTVGGIIESVRARGDVALIEFARQFDRAELATLAVPRQEMSRARQSLEPQVRQAMEHAARNIERVHRAFLPQSVAVEVEPGVTVTRRPDPLGRVGVYAPGGTAAYPSSVLMGAIPARVAGVGEIILCSPPGANGLPSSVVLAAADLAGIDKLFAVGGAGAIAAMAFGTSSIPRVDKIVGPGNAYVAEAKLQLANAVAFDSPAGPSELVIIADQSVDSSLIAREVVAQAEHDPRAIVVVLATDDEFADRIEKDIIATALTARRREIVSKSLATGGGVLSVADIAAAIDASSRFAPEHLMIATSNAAAVADRIRNAGTVFVGPASSVSFGDYITGANHVLPTGGLSRSYSGLSTLDFIRWTTCQTVTGDGAAMLARDTAAFADAEGLYAHGDAARAWEPLT